MCSFIKNQKSRIKNHTVALNVRQCRLAKSCCFPFAMAVVVSVTDAAAAAKRIEHKMSRIHSCRKTEHTFLTYKNGSACPIQPLHYFRAWPVPLHEEGNKFSTIATNIFWMGTQILYMYIYLHMYICTYI